MNRGGYKLMSTEQKLQKKLDVLQSIINRMAANSSNLKLWCVTLLSALVAFVFSQKGCINKALFFLPIVPFGILDAYYLGLEKFYVKQYNTTFSTDNIETIKRPNCCEWICLTFQGLRSFSVWGFYGIIAVVIWKII